MRFLLSIFCFLLCLAAHAQTFSKSVAFVAESVPATVDSSGITFNTIGTNIDTSAESPEDFNHTISTLNNGYIVVHLAYYAAVTTTGVTFDGAAMAAIGRSTNSSDSSLKSELWGLAVASKAAGTYSVSVAGILGADVASFSTSWNGVNQTVSTGTYAAVSGISSTPSATITSATGEVVVDSQSRYGTDAATVGADQTERGNLLLGGQIGGACSSEPGAGSVTMSWTLESSYHWVTGGVPLKPAS